MERLSYETAMDVLCWTALSYASQKEGNEGLPRCTWTVAGSTVNHDDDNDDVDDNDDDEVVVLSLLLLLVACCCLLSCGRMSTAGVNNKNKSSCIGWNPHESSSSSSSSSRTSTANNIIAVAAVIRAKVATHATTGLIR